MSPSFCVTPSFLLLCRFSNPILEGLKAPIHMQELVYFFV